MKSALFTVIVFTLCCTVSVAAGASGWDNGAISARATGMASAFVGLADDASAVFYNPAGLPFIEERGGVLGCARFYFPTHRYIDPGGNDVKSQYNARLVEGFAYYQINDRVTVGMGVYTPYGGGGIEWFEEDLGFYLKGTIGALAISPAVAVTVTDWLAIGGNINGYYFLCDNEIRNPFAVPPEPQEITVDESDFVVTFSASVFARPTDNLSLGLSFHGPRAVTTTGTTDSDGIEVDSETAFDLPFTIALGAAYRFTRSFTLSAEVDFYNWSKLASLSKVTHYPDPIGDVAHCEEFGYEDTFLFKLGADYRFNEIVSLQLGAHYDEGSVPLDKLSLMNIDVPKVSFFGGVTVSYRQFEFSFSGFDTIGEQKGATGAGALTFPGEYDIDSLGFLFGVGYSF